MTITKSEFEERNMNEKSEVATIEPGETVMVPAAAITPTGLLRMAVEKGADLDKLEKLMDLERRWKADLAREAFYSALTEFKKEELTVTKDKDNVQYGSKYTSIGNLVNTVTKVMALFGLSARWEIDQADGIQVTCILSHTLGHSERVSMTGPPDESGKKNSLQQIKSTITYLKSSTFQAVTGVVSQDGVDDDANTATLLINSSEVADLEALISEVGANRAAFLKYCKADKIESITKRQLKAAIVGLEAKR